MIGTVVRAAAPRRQLSALSRRLNLTRVPAQPAKPVSPAVTAKVVENNRPKSRFWRVVVGGTALTVALYGGLLYVATRNDKVMDFVIDKQLPYYEELVDLIETDLWAELKERLTQLPRQGEKLLEDTKRKFAHKTPEQQLQRPPEVELVQEVFEQMPSIKLKEGIAHLADDSVRATIELFNELVALVDALGVGPKKDTLTRRISENIHALHDKLQALTVDFDKELQKRLKDTQSEVLALYTKKELELTQSMLDQYAQEKAALEKKYQKRLANEVAAAREALAQAAVNATLMVRIEQTRRFEKMVKERIDSERGGRLANLDKLNGRLEALEALALLLEEQVARLGKKSAVARALDSLKLALLHVQPAQPAALLQPYVDGVAAASAQSGDEVLLLAAAELQPLLRGESTQLLLTAPQLLAAWEQLAPELRAALLLPPNAGFMGHVASFLFSKLLVPVKGTRPGGRDIELVIARVEQALQRGELDVAVEEAACLRGWSRKLADDWVVEGRKRLEAEFLVLLMDVEARLV